MPITPAKTHRVGQLQSPIKQTGFGQLTLDRRNQVMPITPAKTHRLGQLNLGKAQPVYAYRPPGPAYLSELLHVYTPSRTLRSSSDTRMLEIQQYKRKTHGFRTFSCFGPHIWNSLPQDLRHCSTLSSFKAKLKAFLFSQYFHPN